MEDKVGIGSVRKVKNLVSLTGRLKEDEEESKALQAKAQEFVKKKEIERIQFVNARKERIKKSQLKEERRKKKEEEEKRKKIEDHKELVLKRYEESKQKIEQHQKEREEFKAPIKLEKEYVHDKLEKEYEEKFIIPTLEQKKAQLENIRNFYKPIDREELDEHEKNFLITLKKKQDEKRLKREMELRKIAVSLFITL